MSYYGKLPKHKCFWKKTIRFSSCCFFWGGGFSQSFSGHKQQITFKNSSETLLNPTKIIRSISQGLVDAKHTIRMYDLGLLGIFFNIQTYFSIKLGQKGHVFPYLSNRFQLIHFKVTWSTLTKQDQIVASRNLQIPTFK